MCEQISISVATEVAQQAANKAMKEAHYLCCFQSYVDDFEEKNQGLKAKVESVKLDIEEARDRNANRVDPTVENWIKEATAVTEEDTKKKQKWFFNLCTNCIWQNRRAKDLEGKALTVEELINKSNFTQVARLAGSPGLKFYYSQDFIHFKSRESKHEELKEALKNEEYYMIGLQGMGGAGKTTMAIQVGREVEELKVFDKVIFTNASNSNRPADVVTIRAGIARELNLPLMEGKESENAKRLWTRIAEGGEKMLIIVDDVWDKELNLQAIGIPHQKGCCTILLTTRDVGVCTQIGCQKVIQLEMLSSDDALNLFLFHSGVDSSSGFKDIASEIVEECGRLPVAIVPVAKALHSKPLEYWDAALTRLQTFYPMSQDENENGDLTKAYKSLRLSLDNLNSDKARDLLFVCSLFPEDYEISVELVRRIAIGLGLGGQVKRYYEARSQVLELENKLIESSLLMKVKREFVKLHDLVRDVAMRLANTKIQMVTDSETTLKESIQYSSYNIGDFPNQFGGSELKFLLVWINSSQIHVKVPHPPPVGMTKLRVLLLFSTNRRIISALELSSLSSIQSLRSIRTLILSNWVLRDISILGNLQFLETLDIIECTILELPTTVSGLERLRLMGLRDCTIKEGNPFKVIERCQQLEELYFAYNQYKLGIENEDELHHFNAPPALQRYHIIEINSAEAYIWLGIRRWSHAATRRTEVNDSISRYFYPRDLIKVFSKATFKSLAARAEILNLGGYVETGWKNLVPDIIDMKNGGTKDLIELFFIYLA